MVTPASDVGFTRARAKATQQGQQHSHENEYGKAPRYIKLKEFEYVATHDTTVHAIFEIMVTTLLSLLGPLEHVDPEIDKYLKYNYTRMTDELGVYPDQAMKQAFITALTAGCSVTENLFDVYNGSIFLNDFVTYDPKTIIIRTDRNGRLTEGNTSLDGYNKSGIFQKPRYSNVYKKTLKSEIPLSMWKITHIINNRKYGNYYGTSAIEPIYKWVLTTDAIADKMLVALDRFGTPKISIMVPLYQTNETKTNPETGEVDYRSSVEVVEEKIRTKTLGNSDVIVLPILDKDRKPDIKTLTTGNNIGDTFTNAITFCDIQKSRGLLMPFALLGGAKSFASDNDSQSERQMEIFHRVVHGLYLQFVTPFLSQSWHRLIRFAFNRESAKIPPRMELRRTSRPEERVALMQLISGLTEHAYLNPLNEEDWITVRNWASINERPQDKEDVTFIKDMLIEPKKPTQPAANSATKGKGKPGRPTGTSAPQNKSRPLKGSESGHQQISLDSALNSESEHPAV